MPYLDELALLSTGRRKGVSGREREKRENMSLGLHVGMYIWKVKLEGMGLDT